MAVILPSTFRDGVASVAAGGTVVTGQGTFWGTPEGTGNAVLPGDFFGVHEGWTIRIASVDSNTQLTLADPWPGEAQTLAPYAIMLQSDNARMAETSRQLLQQLKSGNLTAFAGLVGAPDTVPYFTGPGVMGLLSKSDLTNGVAYNAMVNTLPDRAAYDASVSGFAVLVADNGDGRAALYTKRSNDTGDWSAPAFITGVRGLTPRGPWSNATDYVEGDVVGLNGASYVALVDNVNTTPVEGGDATWQVLSARGDVGPGYVPRGTYAGATAYAKYDTVLYNGSQFVALQATTGNAPPTLPTESNTYWTLLAQKGQDGTGTGDFVGPAGAAADNLISFNGTTGKLGKDSGVPAARIVQSPTGIVTDGNAAVFDGTTGRLIKQLTPALFRTWLASTAATVSFVNTTANLAGNPATVQAAIESLAANSGGKQDAIFALEIADLKGSRLGMNGGIADSFDDETGIATKTNATYDATNDWFSPLATIGSDQTATHTAATQSGNTVTASNATATFEGWHAFDKMTGGASGVNNWVNAGGSTGWITYQFSAAKVIGSYTVRSGNGFAVRAPSAWTLQGSNTGAFAGEQTTLDTRTAQTGWTSTGEVRTFTVNSPGSYLYYRINITAQNGGDGYIQIDEITFSAPNSYNNMTLLSVTYPAATVPGTARIALQLAGMTAFTPNVDFSMEVSRDGGTTWTTAVLALTVNYGGIQVYEATVSVSGQPSGSSMVWRMKTLTNKNVVASGVVLQQQ